MKPVHQEEQFTPILKDCRALYVALSQLPDLDADNSCRDQLKDCIRQLMIANMLYRDRIITIAGLQGQGKTTLMRNLYGMDEGVLRVGVERCETLPVFVREDTAVQPGEYHFLKKFIVDGNDSDHLLMEEEVSKEVFNDLSFGYDPSVVQLELRVAPKFFDASTSENGRANIAFLLLPGVEELSVFWQNLINFALVCSDTCIAVFKPETLAASSSEDLHEKLSKLLPQNAHPIYAFSRCENILREPEKYSDKKAELIEHAKDIFQLSDQEESNIVLTGFVDAKIQQQWIDDLMQACARTLKSTVNTRTQQYEMVRSLIEKDLRKVLRSVKKANEKLLESSFSKEIHDELLITHFKKEKAKNRKNLKNKIGAALKQELPATIAEIEEHYRKVDTDKDLRRADTWKHLKTPFVGASRQNERDLKEVLSNTLEYKVDGQKFSRSERALQLGASRLTEETVEQFSNLMGIEKLLPIKSASHALVCTEAESTQLLQEEQKQKAENMLLVQDIKTILQPKYAFGQNNALESADARNLMKAISTLSTLFFLTQTNGKSQELIKINALAARYGNDEIIFGQTMDLNSKKLETVIENKKTTDELSDMQKVAVAVVGSAILDFLPDQELNMIPGLIEGLLAMNPEVIAVLVAAAGVAITVKTNLILNDNKRAEAQLLRVEANNYYTKVKDSYLAEYDRYMETIEEKIYNYLSATSKCGQEEMNHLKLQTLIQQTEDRIGELSKQLGGDIQFLCN